MFGLKIKYFETRRSYEYKKTQKWYKLNRVNEEKFKSLPQATSMFLATGNKFDLNEVLQLVIEEILIQLNKLEKGEHADLKIKYESSLFRKNMISVFEFPGGYRFNGKIKGVNEIGKIVIENENEISTSYQLKEIKMLF